MANSLQVFSLLLDITGGSHSNSSWSIVPVKKGALPEAGRRGTGDSVGEKCTLVKVVVYCMTVTQL